MRHLKEINEGHFDFNLGYTKWGFTTSVSYTNFDDLKMGTHGPEDYLRPEYIKTTNGVDEIVTNSNPLVQKYSGYNQLNIMQKIRFEPYENLSFDLGLFYTTTSDYPRYDRLIRYRGDNLRSAEWNYGPQRWFMSNLKVTKTSSKATFYDNIKATFAYQNFEESRIDRDFEDIIRNIHEESVNALSFNLDLEKDLSKKSSLFYGFEYVLNDVSSEGLLTDIITENNQTGPSRYPNATWNSIAAYINNELKVSDQLILQAGLRYNQFILDADFNNNINFYPIYQRGFTA